MLATRGRVKVLLADPRQLLAQALASVLGSDPELEVIGTRPNLSDDCLRRPRPDVLAVGYPLVLRHGAHLRDEIRATVPELKIIVLVANLDEETLATCVEAGAAACVSDDQSPAELARAIKRVAAGEVLFAPELLVRLLRRSMPPGREARGPAPRLSPREIELLRGLVDGLSLAELAQRMVVTVHTARTHLKNAMTKLDARSPVEAILRAGRLGLVELPRDRRRRSGRADPSQPL